MSDPLNPDHYRSSPARCSCGQPIECIQVAETMDFNLGNAFKYGWRAGLKDGNSRLQDLQKMLWYVQRAVQREETVLAAAKP